ncbi:MAG: NAD(P)H-dependent glycerol-3-phosphate dehydrogenase [Cetobacterium sp.]|uniref:Glycerol-3-phosphate dehydrogenase [NAD(P)+] n=1 Tax=Cetobacterium ceti TaxID=180163 RepID=A0A1T4JZG4_9FUSO|nr:NAD(P)H-dependent glycerol-3-phosphate dehydrogenase [Cetobacterium ceti]MCJ8342185.1 NAD(P)H-dependent glycerol-3-phosphate dehydrogenase [Cetobacterium sp.]SJZ35642.1 glycerol 3-phosphate dehydrogenase (NAD(P)+) [Cetobacterium ceti]
MERVVIVGAGSWGTALGLLLAHKGHEVTMWEHNPLRAEELQRDRENKKLLPGVKFPKNLNVTSKSEDLFENINYVIFSVPSQVLRGVISKFSSQIRENTILVNTAKGIEVSTGLTLSEVMKEEILGKYHKNIIVLSGPTHAEEVAQNLPTTIVAAGELENAKKIQNLFNTKDFRVYVNEDIAGVELGGAVKNCLAIGAGIADGMGFGDNAKAALITRGIAEMIRFGKALGAKEVTFSGLAGIGDLIVTCASKHSRNRYVGEKLGQGETIEEILSKMVMVAEGVPTVKAVHNKAKELKISMPIVEAIYRIIYEGADSKEMVEGLMTRELKEEFY